jgi:hypothetical protein
MYQQKLHLFTEGHWDPKHLSPEQEQAARNAADSILDATVQESVQIRNNEENKQCKN